MFAARQLFPAFISLARETSSPCLISSFIDAAQDAIPMLRSASGFSYGQSAATVSPSSAVESGLLREYCDGITAALDDEMLKPLCLQVETDLRFAQHLNASEPANAAETNQTTSLAVRKLVDLVSMTPMKLFDVIVHPCVP